MSDNRIPKCNLDLNLSLRLPQEEDPDKNQGQFVPPQEQSNGQFMQPLRSDPNTDQGQFVPPQEQSHGQFIQPLRSDPNKDQGKFVPPQEQSHGQFMQPLRSDPQPSFTPQDPMTSPLQFFRNYHQDFSNLPTLPQNLSSPCYQPLEQDQLLPPQAVTVETGESSHRGSKRSSVDADEIQPLYPWSTNRPTVIKTKRDLSLENINLISGQVICKSCVNVQTLEYNLEDKFSELSQYIMREKEQMRHRAPDIWMSPRLIQCEICKSDMKPVNCDKKEINWLFLLLGQMLGCCTLDELKFFCKTNNHHCTGNKHHVLYSAYLGLCKQLDPNGPFNP